MKSALPLLLILASVPAFAEPPSRTQVFAEAIAKAEGFGRHGALPTRFRNPGDLRAPRGVRYPGQIGLNARHYVIFKDEASGWAALRHQVEKIVAGESSHYTVNDTLRQLSRTYATSSVWAKNVARNLGVTSDTALFEILDVPPVLSIAPNQRALDAVLGEK